LLSERSRERFFSHMSPCAKYYTFARGKAQWL
jgi:hypothetical protein